MHIDTHGFFLTWLHVLQVQPADSCMMPGGSGCHSDSARQLLQLRSSHSSHAATKSSSRGCGSSAPLLPASWQAHLACLQSSSSPQGPSSKCTSSYTHINVTCGPAEGVLLFDTCRIVMRTSAGCRAVSPTEFERMGGMGNTRKWRHTILVPLEDGERGV